jgi:hypothetical protein
MKFNEQEVITDEKDMECLKSYSCAEAVIGLVWISVTHITLSRR